MRKIAFAKVFKGHINDDYHINNKDNIVHYENDNYKFLVGTLKELNDYAYEKELNYIMKCSDIKYRRYMEFMRSKHRLPNARLESNDKKLIAEQAILTRLRYESISSIISDGTQRSNLITRYDGKLVYMVMCNV